MQITNKDFATALYLGAQNPAKATLELFKSYSDERFVTRALVWITRAAPDRSILTEEERQKLLEEIALQSSCIYAILGSIYVALGRRLPVVTDKQAEETFCQAKLECERNPEIFDAYFEQFERYNQFWYESIQSVVEKFSEDFSKAVVMWITRTYLDHLPEPLEAAPPAPDRSDPLDDAIKDILG